MKKYQIVNKIDRWLLLDEAVEDGTIVTVRHFPPFAKSPKGSPMRYTNPQFNQRFHIIGEFAYYLGEEIHISSIVKETEELKSKISK